MIFGSSRDADLRPSGIRIASLVRIRISGVSRDPGQVTAGQTITRPSSVPTAYPTAPVSLAWAPVFVEIPAPRSKRATSRVPEPADVSRVTTANDCWSEVGEHRRDRLEHVGGVEGDGSRLLPGIGDDIERRRFDLVAENAVAVPAGRSTEGDELRGRRSRRASRGAVRRTVRARWWVRGSHRRVRGVVRDRSRWDRRRPPRR